MNALECAEWLESVSTGLSTNQCAAMLRKQDAAIKQLRVSLQYLEFALDTKHGLLTAIAVARTALAATEEFK